MNRPVCAICDSPLRAEIETKDVKLRPKEVVDWGKQRGVKLSLFSLAKHRANHMGTADSAVSGNGDGDPAPILADVIRVDTPKQPRAEKKPAPESADPSVTDGLFLNTVRDMVYQKLVDGELELKLDSGFKAIELKYKIEDMSESEKLMLEILNELRGQELRNTGRGMKNAE
jgi:hypothetical protein